ncbi:hypothetical protein B0O99DRAFT_512995 [Bisporella sp. PMI_857]|nr:hypothetical protein B0O99DRAFT_512995 [Bisporella sp. PMI_857]
MRSTLLLVLSSVHAAFAAPKFTAPAAGASLTTLTFPVTWSDDGAAPSISDLTSYTLFLYAGPDASLKQLTQLSTGTFAAGSTVTVTIPPGLGGNVQNAYVLGIISTPASGAGTITNYSPRFSLTQMTGVFSPSIAAITTITAPPAVNQIAAAAPANGGTGDFATPFNEQVGNIRYAAMQPIPSTKITATNTAPLYPTSPLVIATTVMGNPTILTTITQAQTFSVSSHANTAAAASQPVDDMQKYLNRWKD